MIIIDDELGECMLNKRSGKKIPFTNRGGTPIMNLWVRRPDEELSSVAENEASNEGDDDMNTGFLGLGLF